MNCSVWNIQLNYYKWNQQSPNEKCDTISRLESYGDRQLIITDLWPYLTITFQRYPTPQQQLIINLLLSDFV